MSTFKSIQQGPQKPIDKHWLEKQCDNDKCREVLKQIFINTKNPNKIEIDPYNPSRSLDSFCREKHIDVEECMKLVQEFSKCFFSKYDLEKAVPF